MIYRRPLTNDLASQLFATGTTIDLLKWDDTLFDNMHVPDGISVQDVVDCILQLYGKQTLHHPDPAYMKHYIEKWSARKLINWQKLYDTTILSYNPIHNYDRTENIEDTTVRERNEERSGETSGKNRLNSTDTGVSTVKDDKTTEQKVSAENISSYQPDMQNIEDDTQTTTTSASSTDTGERNEKNNATMAGKETETYTHVNRTLGNIGVTTTQQMIAAERECVRYNVIEEIAADYCDMFCLSIY